MDSIDSLLLVARTYAAAEGLDLSTVSWRSMGDTKKLTAIVGGADIQMRRFEKTMRWFSENWPADAVWPAAVARPQIHVAEQVVS
ncbi:hypothetical protein FNL55_12565 [Tardiphaga sp. vice352]|uniref:hypothetical protein n=1 Tax=Tardiphaga sp. vice352 TaxID=2592816 RepID=UPI00116360EC|nr:hypothetical protein [Tardiphaga sp. vice352]QDM32071.1 hypothetical protein FNL55_12565 [Tardiphaga sp. vice352]